MEQFNLEVITVKDFLLAELAVEKVVDDQISYEKRTMQLVEGVKVDIWNDDECTLRIAGADIEFAFNDETAQMLAEWDTVETLEFLDIIQRNKLPLTGN